jgi:hypothetical protein
LLKKSGLLSVLWSVVFSLGVGFAAFGLWLAWHPLGFVALGVVLAILGYGGGIEEMRKVRSR